MLIGSVLKSLLYQYTLFESPHDCGPERAGFPALVSKETLRRQCTFYSPLAPGTNHSQTFQPHAPDLNTPEINCNVQNASLPSCSPIPPWIPWGRRRQRRICTVWGRVLKTRLNPRPLGAQAESTQASR